MVEETEDDLGQPQSACQNCGGTHFKRLKNTGVMSNLDPDTGAFIPRAAFAFRVYFCEGCRATQIFHIDPDV